MTDTTTDTQLHPSAVLTNLIVALLAPTFLTVTAGNIRLARSAAIETVNAYRARNHPDLLAIAQIIAFGLAALSSLSLSMAGDIAPPMTLRLRANANACNRSAEQNRRALTNCQANNLNPHHPSTTAGTEPSAKSPEDHAVPNPGTLLSPAAEQQLAAESNARLQAPQQSPAPAPAPPTTAEKRHQEMWAIAMAKEASEITAGIANLPPAERTAASMRAATLSSAAHDLLYGGVPVPPLKIATLAAIARPDLNGNRLHP